MSDAPTTFTSELLHIPDTLYTYGYGDTCSCIRCAAHPYNAATQNYDHSAYNMATPSELHTDRSNIVGAQTLLPFLLSNDVKRCVNCTAKLAF
jgi:hypothetical protein